MVRQTSAANWRRINAEGLLSKRRLQVYNVLFENGPMTGAQVSALVKKAHGNWGHSETIRNRLTELRDLKVVRELGQVKCPTNGNSVILWDVTNGLPIVLPKGTIKLTRKEIEARLERAELFFRIANNKLKQDPRWSEIKKEFERCRLTAKPKETSGKGNLPTGSLTT